MRQRKIIPGVDPKLLIKDATSTDARRRGADLLRRGQPRRAPPSSPAATSSTATARKPCCAKFLRSMTARRPRCSAVPNWRRPSPRAPSRGRFRSMPITTRTRRRQWTATLINWKSPAWSTTRSRGRLRAARAARGLADHVPYLRGRLERHRLLAGRRVVRLPQAHRRRHLAPNSSGSNAPRVTPTPSTCRLRCIRRRRCRSSSTTRYCRAPTVSR